MQRELDVVEVGKRDRRKSIPGRNRGMQGGSEMVSKGKREGRSSSRENWMSLKRGKGYKEEYQAVIEAWEEAQGWRMAKWEVWGQGKAGAHAERDECIVKVGKKDRLEARIPAWNGLNIFHVLQSLNCI